MNRATRAAAVLFVSLLGLWGCAQGPTATAQAERIKSLEAKTARLEADFRTATAARDQLRQQLAQAEDQMQKLQAVVKERGDLQRQLRLAVNDRDALRRDLAERTGQRDGLQQQLNDSNAERDRAVGRHQRLRKGLLELVGQDKEADWAEEHKGPTPTGPAIGG